MRDIVAAAGLAALAISVSGACAATADAVAKVPPTGVKTCMALDAKLDGGWPTPQACAAAGPLTPIPKQDGMPGTAPPGYEAVAGHPLTSCVRDRVSGLVWEGKPDSGRLPWALFEQAPANAPVFTVQAYGPQNVPAPGSRGNTDGYSVRGDGRPGDAMTYVAQVNASRLCGFADWRLPTVAELHGLVDLGKEPTRDVRPTRPMAEQATIDARWFPNTVPGTYLTSQPFDPENVWCVNFANAYVFECDRDMKRKPPPLFIRLVRGPEVPQAGRWRELPDERGVPGGMVEDSHTGLVWRRCEEPQGWNGRRCTWSAKRYDLVQALQRASEQAGWRLPTIKEVNSLVQRESERFEITPSGFPAGGKGTPNVGYWSSTACGASPATSTFRASIRGWVLAGNGNIYCESLGMHRGIRLVRESGIGPDGSGAR